MRRTRSINRQLSNPFSAIEVKSSPVESEDRFIPLDLNSEEQDAVVSLNSIVFEIKDFVTCAMAAFKAEGWKSMENTWRDSGKGVLGFGGVEVFGNGVKCKLLKPGEKWMKGKFRLRLIFEFCPDEPEGGADEVANDSASPLDDVREMMNE